VQAPPTRSRCENPDDVGDDPVGDDVRVIAGELKGQKLVAPRGWKVRPTSERVREAVFSTLGPRVEGAAVLDLYCGTGALAIEALSRGAARATLVDRDTRPALGNVERLGLTERTELIRADAGAWLAERASRTAPLDSATNPSQGQRFDLVFIDAPYKLADLVARQLDTYLADVLAPGGRAIVESGARRPLAVGSLERLRQRRYGAADVSIYAREGE
jgi:16S rRNA (guanine(966)-N(2))-methyltransferase RsmD